MAILSQSCPVVIYHEDLGVFLGELLGWGFWSKLGAGMGSKDGAPVFPNEEDALLFIVLWSPEIREGIKFVRVSPEFSDGHRVSMVGCVAAGLPAWG